MADTDEKQELDLLKKFWARYRFVILGLTVFFVIVLVGANYWQKNRYTTSNKASQIFQDMVIAEHQQDTESAIAKGQQLMMEFSNTPYAQFAGLMQAKMNVDAGSTDKAIENLRWVINHRDSNNLAKPVAAIRLSALLLQQGKLDEALELVSEDPDKSYAALYAQARGDVYVAKGDMTKAKDEYMQALQTLPIGVKSPILQLKLANLGSD